MKQAAMEQNTTTRGVVGAVWVENPAPWWVPVGLEKTQGPNAKVPAYRNVFFGGTREYKSDEDGMQVYTRKRRRGGRVNENYIMSD